MLTVSDYLSLKDVLTIYIFEEYCLIPLPNNDPFGQVWFGYVVVDENLLNFILFFVTFISLFGPELEISFVPV